MTQSPQSPPVRRRFSTQQQAADHFQVHIRTIRNWLSAGLITGYRLPGQRAIRVDIAQIEAALKMVPTRVARPRHQPFGPKAKIVTVPEYVNPSDDAR